MYIRMHVYMFVCVSYVYLHHSIIITINLYFQFLCLFVIFYFFSLISYCNMPSLHVSLCVCVTGDKSKIYYF